MHEVQHADALLFRTDPHTVTAEDAFARIADQSRTAGVDMAHLAALGETDIADPVAQGQFLELAAAAFAASRAVPAVAGQQQLEDHLAMLAQLATGGPDDAAIPGRSRTGRHQAALGILDHA